MEVEEQELETKGWARDALELVKDIYGDCFYDLIRKMVLVDVNDRYDFVDLINSQEYNRLQKEMDEQNIMINHYIDECHNTQINMYLSQNS